MPICIFSFFVLQSLELQDIQQKKILLHRDVRSMIDQLNIIEHRVNPRPAIEFKLTEKSKLFSAKPGNPNYLGDPDLIGNTITV
jgi:hypothetical protein